MGPDRPDSTSAAEIIGSPPQMPIGLLDFFSFLQTFYC
jgi:hypothetical protein